MPESTESVAVDTRKRLLESALHIFMQEGYARATTRRIADLADVSEVTLFRHFGNKLTLITTAIDEHAGNHSIKTLMEEQLTGELMPDLHHISHHILKLIRDNRDMLRMMVEVHQIPELHQKLRENAQERRELFLDYFQDQIARGVLRPSVDPLTITLAFLGMIHGYGMSAKIQDETPDAISQQVTALIDVLLHGCLA